MNETNHTETPEAISKALDEIAELADLPELTPDDLALPDALDVELLGGMALDQLKVIRQADIALAGARSVHNDTEETRLLKMKGQAEHSLRRIKFLKPEALRLAKRLAHLEVEQVHRQREERR